jgi:septal ring factor EnvC (AmiA/AmiB activator)
MKSLFERASKRYAEADRMLKEKEALLVKMRETNSERERQLQAELQTMSSKLEDSSVRLRQLEWNIQDLEKEKANVVAKLVI